MKGVNAWKNKQNLKRETISDVGVRKAFELSVYQVYTAIHLQAPSLSITI